MVSKGAGRKKGDSLLETHQKYIDLQAVLAGTDDMGWKPKAWCKRPSGEYDPGSDVQFFEDEPDAWISVQSGALAVFFPEDAHAPLVSAGRVRKVVVKIAVG
jgi:YhcH/YjgK/YiaL family protein